MAMATPHTAQLAIGAGMLTFVMLAVVPQRNQQSCSPRRGTSRRPDEPPRTAFSAFRLSECAKRERVSAGFLADSGAQPLARESDQLPLSSATMSASHDARRPWPGADG